MSHISTGVEYALHCLLHLTDKPVGVDEASVRDLAELQGLSVEYVAKLFTKLHKAGLAVATEGARGGFKLARAAHSISVLQVVEAIDGPKPLFDCREIRSRCVVYDANTAKQASKGVCSIHAIMLDAEKRMKEVLQSQTLADIAARTAPKLPRTFHTDVVSWIDQRAGARRGDG